MAAHETRACIALGSNLGDRVSHLERAISDLQRTPGVRVDSVSSIYETDPVGGPAQGAFLNAALTAATTLSARALLDLLQAIEARAGRTREGGLDAPRTLDLDLLLYGAEQWDAVDLVVPPPRMHQRPFVLVPLADVAPDAVHPILGETVAVLAKKAGRAGVRSFTS